MPRVRSARLFRAALLSLSLAVGLSGCGGGGSSASGTASSGNGDGGGSSSTSSGSTTTTTTSSETWNIGTGANAADLHEGLSFRRIAIALDTLAVSSSDGALSVGASSATSSGSSRTITLDGSTVVTITEDSLGLTITAALPAGTLPEFALSGSYGRTVTVLSSGAYKLALEGVTIASANGPALNLQSK
jgi:hypothetical protein